MAPSRDYQNRCTTALARPGHKTRLTRWLYKQNRSEPVNFQDASNYCSRKEPETRGREFERKQGIGKLILLPRPPLEYRSRLPNRKTALLPLWGANSELEELRTFYFSSGNFSSLPKEIKDLILGKILENKAQLLLLLLYTLSLFWGVDGYLFMEAPREKKWKITFRHQFNVHPLLSPRCQRERERERAQFSRQSCFWLC